MVSGRAIAQFKTRLREPILNDLIDDMADSIGKQLDPDALGTLIVNTATDKWTNYKSTITKPLYNAISEMSQGAKISTKTLKEAITSRSKIVEELGKAGEKLGKESAGDNIVAAIDKLPNEISYDAAKELLTRLRTIADEFSITNKNAPAIGLSEKLQGLLNKSMRKGLNDYNPKVAEMFEQVQRLYRVGTKKYNNKFIRGLIRKADPDFGGEPEKVIKMIVKKGGITGLQRIKDIVGPKQWDQLARWWVDSVITPPKGQVLPNGVDMLNQLTSKGFGEKTVKMLLGPEKFSRFKKVATALKTVQEKQAHGTGHVLVQLMQGSAMVGIATGTFTKESLGVLLLPEVLGRVMLHPLGAKWLTEGLITIPKKYAGNLAMMNKATVSNLLRLTNLAKKIKEKIHTEKVERKY